MLKLVEGILEKHLDAAAREYEKDFEMTVVTSFEVIWQWPTFAERRLLARELIEVIRGEDLTNYIKIPEVGELQGIIESLLPSDVAYLSDYIANELLRKLEYRRWRAESGAESRLGIGVLVD